MTFWLWSRRLVERKVGVAVIVGVANCNIALILGDADAAVATEDGEGGWKTVEALPWEGSDRDYTYEEVSHYITIISLIIALS